MKTILQFILIAVSTCCANAQLSTAPTPTWKITFKVANETGQPVFGAKVTVGYLFTNQITGMTDSNGIFVASHKDKSFSLGFDVKKTGFYSFHQSYEMGWAYQYNETKWNPTINVLLRKIGNPIPMYARRKEEGMVLQKENEPMGFDLKAGDWVAPYGNGSHTDMFFTLLHRQIISRTEFDCTLKVSFPNKGDGIVAAPAEEFAGSAFRTSRTAAENGYESELTLRFRNTELATNVFGYFIRVETSLDENENVKSALYGKIPGGFKLYAGTIKPHSGMGFDYYLNPTPNDRNLEFDLGKNLSQNLKLLEDVKEP
jgi:hypothetical protein